MKDLKQFFCNPNTALQRQYEALRSIVVDQLSAREAAKNFGYSVNTIYSLIRDAKSGKLVFFPQPPARGPKKRRTPAQVCSSIIGYRKQGLSCADIAHKICQAGYKISKGTVENIVADAGFPKLPRRTSAQMGLTQKNQAIPERATPLDFRTLKPFSTDCPVAGIYFFLPYIIESGVLEVVQQCDLPASSAISHQQACLSMLLLKLIGNKRLSHIAAYDHEPGFGLFAGLSVLPKASYMSTYSCRTSAPILLKFQNALMRRFQAIYPDFYSSPFINLDFHSIPHFGAESEMERVWVSARSRAMKGANTLFAQDSQSNIILYSHADILRKNEAKAILQFAHYWKDINKSIPQTLVFDCKLTTYQILDTLAKDNIKFITLRKRNKKLLINTERLDEAQWKKLRLPIPKRKHATCSIYESSIILPKCQSTLRQIIVKDHGRAQPTYIITNNYELRVKEVLEIYAKRWHIENKFAEMVTFFNLNALSSPLMIRIHFDILWTIIADTLYHRLSQDLPRFEHRRADTIFRQFIDMPGKILFDGKQFTIKIRKRASTPILKNMKWLKNKITVPWLDNRAVKIEWTA